MLDTPTWNPVYNDVITLRQRMISNFYADIREAGVMFLHYKQNPIEFINDWCDTYDPRRAATSQTRIPLILFPRQEQMVLFLKECLDREQSGLIEKSRDMGATWVSCAFSVWLWIFYPGASIGWGSRKADLVHRNGDLDSIFEKIFFIIAGLPSHLLPVGFRPDRHSAYMRLINPETQASITGESGDDIGRGGRKLIYFKDESAHYEHPESIEAALNDNTRVQIDISSVAGLNNVFHRRREAGEEWEPGVEVPHGKTMVFVMDWRDSPMKSQVWYDERKQKAIDEGLYHIFAQEVDRDYSSAVDNIIIPANWVVSAIDAHLKIPGMEEGGWMAALDVADGGGDRNAITKRKGVVLVHAEEWGDIDTGKTTRKVVTMLQGLPRCNIQYDCLGVGAGVKAESNRLIEQKLMPETIRFVAWDAGAKPLRPDKRVVEYDRQSPLNQDFYANLKAQGWWLLRRRFEKTHRYLTEGVKFPVDEMISLSSKDLGPKLHQVRKELSQVTRGETARMKLLVEKTPDGARSPNIGDSVMMNYHPAKPGFDSSLSWIK